MRDKLACICYNLLDFEGKLALCIGCCTCIFVLSVFGHCNHCSAWSSIERAAARICENVEWNRNCEYIQIFYAFFWVIPQRLNFICRRFGTLCLFHLHRRVGTYLPVKMEKAECSWTSAYKFQTPGNYPKESVKLPEHGESLKSRMRSDMLCHCLPFCSYVVSLKHVLEGIAVTVALFKDLKD